MERLRGRTQKKNPTVCNGDCIVLPGHKNGTGRNNDSNYGSRSQARPSHPPASRRWFPPIRKQNSEALNHKNNINDDGVNNNNYYNNIDANIAQHSYTDRPGLGLGTTANHINTHSYNNMTHCDASYRLNETTLLIFDAPQDVCHDNIVDDNCEVILDNKFNWGPHASDEMEEADVQCLLYPPNIPFQRKTSEENVCFFPSHSRLQSQPPQTSLRPDDLTAAEAINLVRMYHSNLSHHAPHASRHNSFSAANNITNDINLNVIKNGKKTKAANIGALQNHFSSMLSTWPPKPACTNPCTPCHFPNSPHPPNSSPALSVATTPTTSSHTNIHSIYSKSNGQIDTNSNSHPFNFAASSSSDAVANSTYLDCSKSINKISPAPNTPTNNPTSQPCHSTTFPSPLSPLTPFSSPHTILSSLHSASLNTQPHTTPLTYPPDIPVNNYNYFASQNHSSKKSSPSSSPQHQQRLQQRSNRQPQIGSIPLVPDDCDDHNALHQSHNSTTASRTQTPQCSPQPPPGSVLQHHQSNGVLVASEEPLMPIVQHQSQQHQSPSPVPPAPLTVRNSNKNVNFAANNTKNTALHRQNNIQLCSENRSTKPSSKRATNDSVADSFPGSEPYVGPHPSPPVLYRRLYDPLGPVMFPYPPFEGASTPRGELRLWEIESERTISQNSSKRKVNIATWLSPFDCSCSFPVAVKFVEDGNSRDGRSVKREIECLLFLHQKLSKLMQEGGYKRPEDSWPCAELFGYHLDKKNPGRCVLITRKLSGPDLFDIIRSEHNSTYGKNQVAYGYHKLEWCLRALKRIAQYGRLGIRHNDIKPDNIVLDYYHVPETNERLLDVKIIDLGTASMHNAKDFTGGTTWYESPEQKLLEYHTKKHRNPEAAKLVEIGISSDAWGAGLSIAEVLMGRRVVDSMKAPHGPGPLEYEGDDEWAVDPSEWIEQARQALFLHRDNHKFPLCEEAARYVFDSLVIPRPHERAQILEVTPHLQRLADQSLNEMKRKHRMKQQK